MKEYEQRHEIYEHSLLMGIYTLRHFERRERELSPGQELVLKDDEGNFICKVDTQFKKILNGLNYGMARELSLDGHGDAVKEILLMDLEK